MSDGRTEHRPLFSSPCQKKTFQSTFPTSDIAFRSQNTDLYAVRSRGVRRWKMRPNWLIGRNLGAMFPAWSFPRRRTHPIHATFEKRRILGASRARPSKTISHFDITLSPLKGAPALRRKPQASRSAPSSSLRCVYPEGNHDCRVTLTLAQTTSS